MTQPSAAFRRGLLPLAALTALVAPLGLTFSVAALASAAEAADGTSYILFSRGSDSVTMSGSTDDLRRARALRAGREALLYVRRGGVSYAIRDSGTLDRAAAIFAPQHALGERQAELGSQQAALGRRQAALGDEQGRIGRQQSGASPRRAVALGRQQDELGRQQNILGEQQNALGRQQDSLGREQNRLAREADAQFDALLAEALRSGVAQRVN